jgi:phenylacetate-CoA ligase
MSDLPGVKAYQIVQDSLERITVRLVRNPSYNSNVESYIVGALQKLAGQSVQVALSYESEITVPPSGKRQFVVSRIASNYL